MKYFGLVWTALWRGRTRAIFVFLSVVMLFGALRGVNAALPAIQQVPRVAVGTYRSAQERPFVTHDDPALADSHMSQSRNSA